jgi:hypothetical protein
LTTKSYGKLDKNIYQRFSQLNIRCWQILATNQIVAKNLAYLSFSNQNLAIN